MFNPSHQLTDNEIDHIIQLLHDHCDAAAPVDLDALERR